ncbi:MAG: hypothetical protein M3347_12475, partial [Armatimonadota bacterium]|nr:hypothetical protein [Armatimonadota bacterium]
MKRNMMMPQSKKHGVWQKSAVALFLAMSGLLKINAPSQAAPPINPAAGSLPTAETTTRNPVILAAAPASALSGNVASGGLRRPISPQQPMWLIHIDTWNWADPQKIIGLVPEDIRPYVVMNVSLSISHNVDTSKFNTVEYGYETAKSWVRTCAAN